jgi:hypothetical protein
MPNANIHDRVSIERIYSRDDFARDASENERRKPGLLKGVQVTSAPDANGNFMLVPASQQVGEVSGAVFLAPFHRVTAEEDAAADPDPRHGYEAFLDDIIEAARRQGYRSASSPGPGDPRLRGLRQ